MADNLGPVSSAYIEISAKADRAGIAKGVRDAQQIAQTATVLDPARLHISQGIPARIGVPAMQAERQAAREFENRIRRRHSTGDVMMRLAGLYETDRGQKILARQVEQESLAEGARRRIQYLRDDGFGERQSLRHQRGFGQGDAMSRLAALYETDRGRAMATKQFEQDRLTTLAQERIERVRAVAGLGKFGYAVQQAGKAVTSLPSILAVGAAGLTINRVGAAGERSLAAAARSSPVLGFFYDQAKSDRLAAEGHAHRDELKIQTVREQQIGQGHLEMQKRIQAHEGGVRGNVYAAWQDLKEGARFIKSGNWIDELLVGDAGREAMGKGKSIMGLSGYPNNRRYDSLMDVSNSMQERILQSPPGISGTESKQAELINQLDRLNKNLETIKGFDRSPEGVAYEKGLAAEIDRITSQIGPR